MRCQLSTLLLCCITILYARNEVVSMAHCPCTWNAATYTADCYYNQWLSSSKPLQKVPTTDCVPATTRILDLYDNNITYRPGQFQIFTELTQLDLSLNKYFTPSNDSFSGLDNLQDLKMDWTDLRHFRHSLFTEPSNLETLLVGDTRLRILTAKLFDNLQHLNTLELSGNGITDTSISAFAALHSLRDLSLRRNDGIILTKQSFTGLASLMRLNLSKCGLTYLKQDVFDELTNLSELYISGNSLSEIQDNQFERLQKLVFLDISMNLNNIQFQPLAFAGLSKLKYLNLDHTRLRKSTSFPNDVFWPLRKIEELHLVGFCIDMESYHFHQEDISENLSKLLSLKKLYVDNFVVSSLDTGFSGLVNLEMIKFNGHYAGRFRIDTFSNVTFENLRNSPVSMLVMDNYKTKNISPIAFSYFGNLTALYLTNLELSDWCEGYTEAIETGLQDTNTTHLRLQLRCQGSFHKLYSIQGIERTPLELLDLSYGSITGIDVGFFYNLPVSLEYLYLRGNNIRYLWFNHLYRLQNLVLLDLSDQIHVNQHSTNDTLGDIEQDHETSYISDGTGIAWIDGDMAEIEESVKLSPQNTNQGCYELPPSLETINIAKSSLFCVLKEVLCDADNALKTLILADQYYLRGSSCSIIDIWGLLKNLRKLETLNLNGNGIKTIPSGSLGPLTSLRNLRLKQNSLAILEFDLQTFALQTLDVSDNNVLYISTALCDKLDEIPERTGLTVYLNNNSFLCDCERFEFLAWLRGSSAIYQREKLTCHDDSEKKISFNEMGKLHETLRYKCAVKEVTWGCVATFVMLHLILGILYAIWYRRWKIRYLLAVGRKTVYPFHPIEDCQIELEYDVYISYERDYDVSRDRTLHQLVAQVIYPALQRRGYRVVIRDELEPGVGLYHSISHTLRRCKKVVALLSRDYCRDYWNVFEFNISVLEGIYTKIQVIIPVAFEQIGRANVHDEIFAFLRAGEIGHHTANVTDEMLVDYLCDRIRDNREFGE